MTVEHLKNYIYVKSDRFITPDKYHLLSLINI